MRRAPAPEIVNFRMRWDKVLELALVTGLWALNVALIIVGISALIANID